MNKVSLKIVIFGMLFFVCPLFVKAQESALSNASSPTTLPPPGASSEKNNAVATVNVENFKILSQEGNNFKLSFDISNKIKVQPGIKYAVGIILPGESENFAYQKVYNEAIDLGENSQIHKEIEFNVPDFFKGEYKLNLLLRTQAGMPLSNAFENVTLNGSGQYLDVKDCYVIVNQEEEKKYTIRQGVDISSEENITGKCKVKNNFASGVNFKYKFDVYKRNIFGDLISSNKDSNASVALAEGEEKEIDFPIPKASNPQAYDAVLVLLSESGKAISNEVNFHYVIRGASALIQNVRFDKVYYQEGETALVNILWSPSADNFLESRVEKGTDFGKAFFNIIINDSNGKPCSEIFKQSVEKSSSEVNFSIPIINNCSGPNLKAEIADQEGKNLDGSVWSVKEASSKDFAKGNLKSSKKELYLAIGAILLLLGGGSWLIFLIRKSKDRNIPLGILIFIVFSIGILFSSGGKVLAETVILEIPTAYDTARISFTFDVSGPICPGQDITLSVYRETLNCGNGRPVDGNGAWWIGGHEQTYYFRPGIDPGWQFWGEDLLGWSTLVRTGSSTPGTNGVDFLVNGTICIGPTPGAAACWSNSVTASVPYTVNPVVNGVCGSANGVPIATAPSLNLCSSGTASGVSSSGNNWVWSCSGSCGGGTASCSAPKGPSLTFSASPSAVPKNGTATLTWTTQGATSCTASGDWSGSKNAAGGTESTGALTASKTYGLECWGSTGISTGIKTASVHVNQCVNPENQNNSSALCAGDEEELSSDTNITNVDYDGCTDGRKCEYACVDPDAKASENCAVPSQGECGEAAKKIYCQKPTVSLCSNDGMEASSIKLNGDYWEWTCGGLFGGSDSLLCRAVKSCSFREVPPN